MPGLTSTRILISPRIRALLSPNLLERSASILLGPTFTVAALQLQHIALCIPGVLAMEGNRPLQAIFNPRVLGVCQLGLLKATISGRVLDATSARWLRSYISLGMDFSVSFKE